MPFSGLFRAVARLARGHHALATPPPGGGRLFALALLASGLGLLAAASAPLGLAGAQTPATATCAIPCDPGVRPGPPSAGGPIAGLNPAEQAFFTHGRATFEETDTVSTGLGPRFNMDSCAGCHAYPAIGGSSPPLNPQVAVATEMGGKNSVPYFVTQNGPVREARFIFQTNPNGSVTSTPDGGVHDLFTIAGRADAPKGCNLTQPDFRSARANDNLIFRIPTPTFGNGLIAAIPDSTIVASENAFRSAKAALGISGHENRSGNDGSITRFGWKAQNKSLLIFAGEAYNVEQGVTNEVFPNEREEGCANNALPEDHTHLDQSTPQAVLSDVAQFALFMQFTAPPTPGPGTATTAAGAALFAQVGCAMCHTPSMTTGQSSTQALSGVTARLYSDLLVHNMGSNLADGISQGNAAGDEFRTAPLWGLGQRIFLLHDGRTSDLLDAIEEHASRGSEANAVIDRFNTLSPQEIQRILVFLRSL